MQTVTVRLTLSDTADNEDIDVRDALGDLVGVTVSDEYGVEADVFSVEVI